MQRICIFRYFLVCSQRVSHTNSCRHSSRACTRTQEKCKRGGVHIREKNYFLFVGQWTMWAQRTGNSQWQEWAHFVPSKSEMRSLDIGTGWKLNSFVTRTTECLWELNKQDQWLSAPKWYTLKRECNLFLLCITIKTKFDACDRQMSWPRPSAAAKPTPKSWSICIAQQRQKTTTTIIQPNWMQLKMRRRKEEDETIVPHKYSQNHLRISSN